MLFFGLELPDTIAYKRTEACTDTTNGNSVRFHLIHSIRGTASRDNWHTRSWCVVEQQWLSGGREPI